jgi:hypothetical protein
LAEKLDKKRLFFANSLLIFQPSMTSKTNHDPQMSLDYHLVDPLGDDEEDEQQSDVLDGC